MHVGIVAQKGNPRAAALAGDISRAVGATVVVDESTAGAVDAEGIPADRMDTCDLVVSIGGDGTFLFAARGAGDTPIMGVNLGEVGFLNATAPEDCVETVERVVTDYQAGAMAIQEMPRIEASGEGWSLPPALNEVVVMGTQRGHGNGIEAEVRVDGSLYGSGQADGVLVATPAGTTAYNLSEGGPLVHPSVEGFVVTEMAARDPMPSLVVTPDSEVTVRVDASGTDGAVVVGDGRRSHDLDPPAAVTVRRADVPVRVAGPDLDFFAALSKLD
ncbi:NAD(+)/NADH kinase [Halomarina litorea]|uniref:NAD(+)/NADH kinase n=1 Tax=Halomarina litorea TaxID=2961595 RepID=UPI0020C34921|nr:NAD(+)/NADH kinase [Halomarina sp. BCD28]